MIQLTIQWYPGHMAKARRQFQEKLKLVDIVFELVDARIPYSSQNPDLQKIIGDKPRLIILTKNDLADPRKTDTWLQYFKDNNIPAVAINAQQGVGMKEVVKLAKQVLAEKFERQRSKGMKPRAIRAVSVGIPNVGKSTVINRLAKRNVANTGNKPGVTKAQQWIKFEKELELLDTPGILWPKFEDQEVGRKLALTGAIKDQLLHLDDISLYGIEYLRTHYPNVLTERYGLSSESEKEASLPEILIEIGQKRGFKDDYERAAEMFIYELRDGKIGRFTFDDVSLEERAE